MFSNFVPLVNSIVVRAFLVFVSRDVLMSNCFALVVAHTTLKFESGSE